MRVRVALLTVVLLAGAGVRAGESRTTKQPARLRSGPGVVHPIQKKLDAGAKLTVLEDGKRWVKVRLDSDTVGWVSSRVFEKPAPVRGYGKVLTEGGLEGATGTVVTMAARGLAPTAAGGSPADALLQEFLERPPFEPATLEALLDQLGAGETCPALEKFSAVAARQLRSTVRQDELEDRLGRTVAMRLLAERTLGTDAAMDAYLNQVGMAVARRSRRYDLSWRFVLFEDAHPSVLALPGGLVLVSTGLLPALSDESQLAGILGQAVAHISLGHGAARAASTLASGDGPKQPVAGFERLVEVVQRQALGFYSGPEELEADALGAALAACAGYDPAGLAHAYRAAPTLAGRDATSARKRAEHLTDARQRAALPDGKRFCARYRARLQAWSR